MSGVIGISTPEQGRYSVFYASLAGMKRPDEQMMVVFARGAVISENRNNITAEALKHNLDWILYLDDDQILTQDVLMKLLEADKDVISAHYIQRQPPFNPVLMETELPNGTFIRKTLDPNEKGIIEVAAAGAGCLLVKTKVIKALEPPYWTLGQINSASWGDDLHFCSRVRKAGFKIYADLDNPIGHIMSTMVWPTRDEKQGWVASVVPDIGQPPIAYVPMPMHGDF